MSTMITLRACLVAGGAALAVALTGCAGPATQTDQPGPVRLDLGDALGRVHNDPAPVEAHTGTDAGLIPHDVQLDAGLPAGHDVAPTPVDVVERAPAAAVVERPAAPAPVAAPAPAPVVVAAPVAPAPAAIVAPAPVVLEQPAPVEPTCGAGEDWDGDRCVATQLPEESAHRSAELTAELEAEAGV